MLEKGLNTLLPDKSIWEYESLDDIRLNIDADNLDQATSLADHEIHMFQRMRTKCAEHVKERKDGGKDGAEVANLETLFHDVYEDVKAVAGALGKNDCISIKNLAMKLLGTYGDFLVRFHFMYVNLSALKAKPEIFGFLAALGDKLPYVKNVSCWRATWPTPIVTRRLV